MIVRGRPTLHEICFIINEQHLVRFLSLNKYTFYFMIEREVGGGGGAKSQLKVDSLVFRLYHFIN